MKTLIKILADDFTRQLFDGWFAFQDQRSADERDRLAAQPGLVNRLALLVQDRMLLSAFGALILSVTPAFIMAAFVVGPWRPICFFASVLYSIPVEVLWMKLAGIRIRHQSNYTPGELYMRECMLERSAFARARFKADLNAAQAHYENLKWAVVLAYSSVVGFLATRYELWTVVALYFEQDLRQIWLYHREDLWGLVILLVLSGFYFLAAMVPQAWLKKFKRDLKNWEELDKADEHRDV